MVTISRTLKKSIVGRSSNFEQFWKNLFIHPENAKTLRIFEFDVDQMFLVTLCMAETMHGVADKMCGVANTIRGAANTMHGAANVMHVRCGG